MASWICGISTTYGYRKPVKPKVKPYFCISLFNYHTNSVIVSKCFVYSIFSSPELDVQQEKIVEMCNALIIPDKDAYDSARLFKLNVSDVKEQI